MRPWPQFVRFLGDGEKASLVGPAMINAQNLSGSDGLGFRGLGFRV